ncbi:MAG: radical SAM protein [Deltaproteobacteria bacterium]|nr:radical SAM protein [Deltaproteobacteria bacterium]
MAKQNTALDQSSAFKYERDPNAVRVPQTVRTMGAFPIREVSSWTRTKEKLLTQAANIAWHGFQAVNRVLGEGKPFQPAWAPEPLLKSYQKSKPPLGWPRETDSLCPKCVKEVREGVISGTMSLETMMQHPGAVKAKIIQRDKEIWMTKSCPKHGYYEDLMSNDADFFAHIEKLYPGRDFKSPKTEVRNHGISTIQYGRGVVLNVDLTNRCNMMCEPCFMDANQVGYVHELTFDEVKEVLDNSLKVKPRRQMSVQFTGGEPTMSPFFLDAIRYAKKVGYFSVQAATNGIRFAQDPGFAQQAYDAGLRVAYLQFDGVSNDANQHRKIGNLFEIKCRAIENLHNAGITIVLVVTLVNTVNDDQVGPIIKFAIDNSDKICFIAFQPVSFTGRDEDIDDETRKKWRFTSSHLAHEVKKQTGLSEPLRDWYPLSIISVFADLVDRLKGPDSYWGTMSCSCHPNCGVGTALMVNKKTKEFKPVSEFINLQQLLKDIQKITDANRGETLTKAQMAAAVLRNYDPSKAPKGLALKDLLMKFDKQSGGALSAAKIDHGVGKERMKDEWLIMFVGSMWFQDVFNYDFRRTEMCIIPYGTQKGEISFCAYNTGVGWRNIVEEMYKNASLGDWYKKHGRHEIYATGKPVDLPSFEHTLKLPTATKAPEVPESLKTSSGGCGSGGCH